MKKTPAPPMSQRKLAESIQLSQPTVNRYLKRGMPADVDGARQWLVQNVNYRIKTDADRDAQLYRHLRMQEPDESETAADAEARMYRIAHWFVVEQGIERFGPLLVALACAMSDDGHEVWGEMHMEHPDSFPDATWDAASDEYFKWYPPKGQG